MTKDKKETSSGFGQLSIKPQDLNNTPQAAIKRFLTNKLARGR